MKNKTIWKFGLMVDDVQNLMMPKDAEILSVQMQGDMPCVWALVDPKEPEKEARNIETFGTGHPIGCDMGTSRVFIGTYQVRGCVFHVFEYTGV